MGGVLLFDTVNTLLGQPGSYWQHPSTANEGTAFFGLFLGHSWWAYLFLDVVYLSVFLFLVSVSPRKTALVVAFAFILGHYYGASTWLSHRWHFTTSGPVVYAIVLSVIIVRIVFGANGNKSESLSSNEKET